MGPDDSAGEPAHLPLRPWQPVTRDHRPGTSGRTGRHGSIGRRFAAAILNALAGMSSRNETGVVAQLQDDLHCLGAGRFRRRSDYQKGHVREASRDGWTVLSLPSLGGDPIRTDAGGRASWITQHTVSTRPYMRSVASLPMPLRAEWSRENFHRCEGHGAGALVGKARHLCRKNYLGALLLRTRSFNMSTLVEPREWDQLPLVIATTPSDNLLSVDKEAILTQFKTHGAVLFRSFTIGVDRFRAFVMSYSNRRIPYPGGNRDTVSEDGMMQTVDLGRNAGRLHSELSHTPFRPDICWFHCVKAPAQGGQTTLCDGALLAAALPSHTREILEGSLLRYRRTVAVGFLERIFSIEDPAILLEALRTDPVGQHYEIRGNEVVQDFVAPALHKPKFLTGLAFANNVMHNFRPGNPLLYPTFEDGSSLPEELIVDVCDTAQQYTFDVQWQNEDLLMFDNTRFLHGRRAILDPHRTIWTQFSDAAF